ncbi:MAG TPA: TMEM175 family protein [Methylocystis sp.]|nr:TMEM175 family protein [Methylocystis sp.]
MNKERLTAFSDGVFAIIITIMVLELKAPEGAEWRALAPLAPTFLAYALSFAYVAIYWNNHHHLLQATRAVSGAILWANMALMFCLSLVPFSTAWLSATRFASAPVTLYGVTLLAPGVAYFVLSQMLIKTGALEARSAEAIGADRKGKISVLLYVAGIGLGLVAPLAATGIYTLVALMWLAPDRRIEAALTAAADDEPPGSS